MQELKTVNAKFIETMAERSEKEIVRNLQGAKKLREELDTLYRQFIRKIDALGVVSPNPELVACIASLNQLIQETRNARTIHKGLVGAYTTDGEWEDEENGQECQQCEGKKESGAIRFPTPFLKKNVLVSVRRPPFLPPFSSKLRLWEGFYSSLYRKWRIILIKSVFMTVVQILGG